MGSVFAAGMVAVERTLTCAVPAGGSFIDVSAMLGRANQRLYRQGMLYTMSVSYQGNWPIGTPAQIEVSHLPNNWAVRKAHQLALRSYKKSLEDEIEAGVKPGRWHDFRVFFNDSHTTANNVNTPFGSLGLGTGEIQFTQGKKADGTDNRQFQFYGPSAFGAPGRFGMLYELDQNADTDTNTPAATATQVAYSELIGDQLSDLQANQMKEDGDNPPYDPEVLTNNIVFPLYFLNHPKDSNRHSTPMMDVPAGLLSINNRSAEQQFLNITLKAGSYKGVHAEVL